jgi:4-hydroxy-4-methyl-2-oxoglutarate aldolase
MARPTATATELETIRERYLRLYTGAISDMLDKHGWKNQVLPRSIVPMAGANRMAGPAFTVEGDATPRSPDDEMERRLDVLSSITPGAVTVWACGGSTDCAHWGEIMSTAAREGGSVGAILSGGVRDVDFINALGYPVFAEFRSCVSSIGRWEIKAWQEPVQIGNTVIRPGDFVFADIDGVVVVPAELTLEILTAAEAVYAQETVMREELRRGVPIKEVYTKYGLF